MYLSVWGETWNAKRPGGGLCIILCDIADCGGLCIERYWGPLGGQSDWQPRI